jgi:hypothetical protein
MVLASGSVIVDDMTVHEHAAGQIAQVDCIAFRIHGNQGLC